MDLAVLVVGLGSAFLYVLAKLAASRRTPPSLPSSPAPPTDAAALLRATMPEVPTAGRFTHDPMGVIRTSNPGRVIPRSPWVILALVVLAVVVLVNVPFR